MALALLTAGGCSSASGGPPAGLHVTTTHVRVGAWTIEGVALDRGAASTPLLSASCPSASDCLVAGGTGDAYVLATVDGGRDWVAKEVARGKGLDGVSCATAASCLLLGVSDANSESDVDSDTPVDEVPVFAGILRADPEEDGLGILGTPAPALEDLACPGPTTCLGMAPAVGSRGVVVAAERDLGGSLEPVTWQPVAGTHLAAVQTPLSCSGAGVCSVAGTAPGGKGEVLLLSAVPGAAWRAVPLPARADPGAVSCPSVSVCVEVDERGGSGWVTHDGGRTWSERTLDPDGGIWNSVTCDPAGGCLALGADAVVGGSGQSSSPVGLASVSGDGGDSWKAASPFSTEVPQAAACIRPRDCVVAFGDASN